MEAIKLHSSHYQVELKNLKVEKSLLFNCLTEHQINEVTKYATLEIYTKGEHIYKKGDNDEYIYYLDEGSVKIYSFSTDGKEIIKSILHNQSILGEEIFTSGTQREDSAKAIDPEVRILKIHVDDFKGLIQRYWDLNIRFIELMNQKYLRTQQRVEGLIIDDARKRIIDFLKYNAQHKGKKIGFELLIKHGMTQQDIANYTGTSRQTVTSILNDLKKANQIYFKRNSILIRDITNLV